jgi:uncharacterized membrane protein
MTRLGWALYCLILLGYIGGALNWSLPGGWRWVSLAPMFLAGWLVATVERRVSCK